MTYNRTHVRMHEKKTIVGDYEGVTIGTNFVGIGQRIYLVNRYICPSDSQQTRNFGLKPKSTNLIELQALITK